ncbi:tetratricopeptide repeat protein [Cupriavidus basilensis]|uniref:tetratricopeptide repeat protein n=1 Tax=Cupriavidus basilensis TaxID=68895 RepID=UPI0020A683A5|nr:tetratricopeptide repeat protein [Cupriavidus basilensis]MCP3022735.1 tetratricopeptide repeat protein [Cupriavidus basilensis]
MTKPSTDPSAPEAALAVELTIELEAGLTAAIAYLNQGNIDAAASYAAALIGRYPAHPAVCQLSAQIALQRGEATLARRHIAQGLSLRPDHLPSLLIAGRAALADGAPAEALPPLLRACALSGNALEPSYLACVARLQSGAADAVAELGLLIQRAPGFAPAWIELAEAMRKGGELQAALAALDRALALDGNIARAHFQRGKVLHALGRKAEAAGAFASAVALEPRSREARLNLAIAQQELGELAAAQATLEALVGAHPQDYDGWIQLGLVRQDRRDLRGAQAALRSALACRPDAAPAAVNLGIVLQEDGQPDAALAAYAHAYRVAPETFGRIAQALCSGPHGRLWADLGALRALLTSLGYLGNPGSTQD